MSSTFNGQPSMSPATETIVANGVDNSKFQPPVAGAAQAEWQRISWRGLQ